MYASNINSAFAPSAHRIDRSGLGYSRALENDELIKMAPAIFAPQAHTSRSGRYAYVPTIDVLAGMRNEGFLPVKVSQAKAREDGRRGFCKHLIRFRREDQLSAAEAREVVMVNSHDGSSSFRLMAGMFRLVCANGLVVGDADNEIRVGHSGNAIDKVIEGAYSIVNDFDRVAGQISEMKALPLKLEQQHAFARAALGLRFDNPNNCGILPLQVLSPRRLEDKASDIWTTFNVVQENIIRGGLHGQKIDNNGHKRRVSTRTINGIDQNVGLNRGLWILAEEMRKLVA